MRTLLLAATVALSATAATAYSAYYQGYARQDGTYVAPHYESAPEYSDNNNWSRSPNVNPYIGQFGSYAPTFNDRSPGRGLGW
jgi:hypothetical protein